jgi:hypothetical protein
MLGSSMSSKPPAIFSSLTAAYSTVTLPSALPQPVMSVMPPEASDWFATAK